MMVLFYFAASFAFSLFSRELTFFDRCIKRIFARERYKILEIIYFSARGEKSIYMHDSEGEDIC